MVTRMHILLEPSMDTGSVALFEMKRFLCGGDASTDLEPGKYQLVPDIFTKKWKIQHVGARSADEAIRFTIDIDGPDPFALTYANPCDLEITRAVTADAYMPDPFIEQLPEIGATAYQSDANYVDNGLAAATYDVIGGGFTLEYENGDRLELTSYVRWADLVDQINTTGAATVYTYYRLRPPLPPRIFPRRFDKYSTPNIAAMVKDVVETIPGAKIGFQLGRILLDFVQLGPRPLGRGVVTPKVSPRPMRLRGMPKDRIAPVGGTVNVGGGLEKGSSGMTNLNPIVPGTGGPTKGIPNHVPAGFEDMGDIFQFGSVQRVTSSRLPYNTVHWADSAQAAYSVMPAGGKISLNVWTSSQNEVDQVIRAFTDAGFKDVKNMTGAVGTGTLITGVK